MLRGRAEDKPLDDPGRIDRILSGLIEAIPEMVLVLNGERRAIAANRRALETLGKPEELVIGRRPGELLGCIGAEEAPDGCGTGARCGFCGALQAILACRLEGQASSREARILVGGGGALDLLVSVNPAQVECVPLTICVLRDISDQKRRAVLENLFFHDILNTVGGLHGLAGMLADTTRPLSPERERDCLAGLARLAERLIEEINHQRDLLAAERGEFCPRLEEIDVPSLLREVRELYANHPVARGRSLEIVEAPALALRSDATILRRVLGNLVKNALEATPEGGVVTLRCRDLEGQVGLEVGNPGVMPPEVQFQVFQRSFSTKAARGRGIGTYSIRLFVERYLKGAVGFTSAEPGGTSFRVTLPREPAASAT